VEIFRAPSGGVREPCLRLRFAVLRWWSLGLVALATPLRENRTPPVRVENDRYAESGGKRFSGFQVKRRCGRIRPI